jgi:polysaccharide biosynthesis/export protein
MTAKLLPLILALTACANLGHYVWVDDYKPAAAAEDHGYVIAPGDVISIRVFNQESMSAHGKVRPDGKISMPFLNDVVVAGYTPTTLAQQMQTRLKEFINTPMVTVLIDETRKINVSMLGEVRAQGTLALPPGATMLEALAASGGLSDLAHRDRIFVLRQANTPVRVRFSFDSLSRAEGKAPGFHLRDGDVVVVE